MRFEDMFPEVVLAFENAFMSYMQYVQEVETGQAMEDFAKIRKRTSHIELDRDPKGFPLLPPATDADSLPNMKNLVWSFLTLHYS
jgi:hypothetical protein